MKRRKKKTTKAQSQYAQEVAAQKAAENYASMAAAAASKYSQPPPTPPLAPVISEDPLGGDVQVVGEKAITERVPESLPVDPIVTSIRGDGRCHVAAIQAAKNGLDYWIRVSRYANGTAIINEIASEEQTMSALALENVCDLIGAKPRLMCETAVRNRAHACNSTPPSQRKGTKFPKHNKESWKLELCSQCYIRHKCVEVVYIEFEDGQSKEIHSKRQNGRAVKCSKYVSDLSQKEKTEFTTGVRRMKRNGDMKKLYESTKINSGHCG
jgi:hypothetical protein